MRTEIPMGIAIVVAVAAVAIEGVVEQRQRHEPLQLDQGSRHGAL